MHYGRSRPRMRHGCRASVGGADTTCEIGHKHLAPSRSSAHINVGVEQLEYRPIRLDGLRRLARCLVTGEDAPGATMLPRIHLLEGGRG